MKKSHELLEIFPIALYKAIIPPTLSSITPFLKEQPLYLQKDTMDYGERSKNSYILNDPQCLDLSKFILDSCKEYGDILGYDYSEYRLSQSWVSIKNPNQGHIAHTHPNSLISGVMYFGQITEDTPNLFFHRPSSFSNVHTSHFKIKPLPNKFTSEVTIIPVEPGMLILFPSSLHHSVPTNLTNTPRYSLAFNVVPKGPLGDEGALTELKFN